MQAGKAIMQLSLAPAMQAPAGGNIAKACEKKSMFRRVRLVLICKQPGMK
jgi:hypothetical protein